MSSQYAGLVISAETSLIEPALSVVCVAKVSSGHDACRYSVLLRMVCFGSLDWAPSRGGRRSVVNSVQAQFGPCR